MKAKNLLKNLIENKQNEPDNKQIKLILDLFNSKKLEEVKKEINKQISKFPNSSILNNILGAVLAEENQLVLAIEQYKKSIKLKPNYAEAYNNLGVSLEKLNKYEEAIEKFEKAIFLKKNFSEAIKNLSVVCNNYGNLLSQLGRFDDANDKYAKGIEIRPDYAIAYSNLLFNLNFKNNLDQKLYLSWAKKFRENCKNLKDLNLNYNYDKNPKKLKIGCVSADFGEHPGGYFTLSTLRDLRKKNFELVAYSTHDRKDEASNNFKNLFSKWNSIQNKSDKEVIAQILDDKIHILIDMQGHSGKNRLPIFFYKAAPIQATWLGQGSSGISEIDYFIGSPHITPKEEEKYYVEKVLRLPEISQCLTIPEFQLEVSDLPAKKNNFITFGSFNQFSKINDEVISLWSKILLSIKNSKLFLKTQELSNKKFSEEVLNRFKKFNINRDHLILEGKSKTRKEVLETYRQIDISLDPFPFQGNTSTCESIWMGVPVLTLKGDRHLFHFGESINSNLNMKNWIADNENDYLTKAVKFSSDLDRLSNIRMGLRKEALLSPVFDSSRFSKNFGEMLWSMWSNFTKK